jgi:predicted RNA binding protein YcfA (HicA-like mRNA interferase family)
VKKLPELPYSAIIRALQRDGWSIVRQRGSHIRLHKHTHIELFKITVPAHKPVKRNTLMLILKQAHLSLEEFEILLGGKKKPDD